MVLELHMSEATGDTVMDDALVDKIVTLVPRLDKARMFRGRGGEILRAASCKLVESVARADMAMPVKNKVALVEFLNENIRHPHDYIQQAAADALRHALFAFFSRGGVGSSSIPSAGMGASNDDSEKEKEGAPSVRLQELTVLKYVKGIVEDENVAAARGYALALGALPEKLLLLPDGRLGEVFASLREGADVNKKIAGEPDAECRRNCVQATVEIVERLIHSPMLTTARFQAAFAILLDASNDHSVDKRGDTGSWSRVAALQGMERLVYAQNARKLFVSSPLTTPMAMTSYGPGKVVAVEETEGGKYDSGRTATTTVARKHTRIAFSPCSLGHQAVLAASASGGSNVVETETTSDVVMSTVSSLAVPIAAHPDSTTASVDSIDSHRVISVLLKQLCEKLDTVRDVAGQCLVRLLSTPESLFTAPDRDILRNSFIIGTTADAADGSSGAKRERVNWAHPAHVFPRLSGVLASPTYFHAIISGLVIAVGGLSETVVRESTRVLLQFTKQTKEAATRGEEGPTTNRNLASSLLVLLREHANEDRVTVPLMKTLILLLRNGVFEGSQFNGQEGEGGDGSNNSSNSSSGSGDKAFIAQTILDLVHAEYSTSGNVIKIKLCVDVLLQMFLFAEPVRGKAYKYVVICLGHKYPSVRKHAAEQLYLQLLSDRVSVGPSIEDIADASSSGGNGNDSSRVSGLTRDVSSLDEAQTLLVTTAWDNSVKEAREARLRYCAITGLQMQVKKADPNADGKPKEKKVKDELDSYASLVAEAGY
jgi:hypothetical protein